MPFPIATDNLLRLLKLLAAFAGIPGCSSNSRIYEVKCYSVHIHYFMIC